MPIRVTAQIDSENTRLTATSKHLHNKAIVDYTRASAIGSLRGRSSYFGAVKHGGVTVRTAVWRYMGVLVRQARRVTMQMVSLVALFGYKETPGFLKPSLTGHFEIS